MKFNGFYLCVSILSLFLFVLFSLQCVAQEEFSFELYFEDAVGNKDTLVLGYDTDGTQNADVLFNEVDIASVPWSPVFEVRAANYDVLNPVPSTGNPPTVFMKKQIIEKECPSPYGYMAFNVLINIKAMNFPVTLKWDASVFDDECNIATAIHAFHGEFSDWEWGCCPTFMSSVIELDSNIASIISFYPLLADSLTLVDNLNSYQLDEEEIQYVRLSFSELLDIPPSGINEQEVPFINLYPNPAMDQMVITGMSSLSRTLNILNAQGSSIRRQKVNNSSEIILNTGSLPQGVYMIRIETPTNQFIEKFTVIK